MIPMDRSAVNAHLSELRHEAEQNRLAKRISKNSRPSTIDIAFKLLSIIEVRLTVNFGRKVSLTDRRKVSSKL